jgi:RimJ/RimL family protein N-acetyltransferase
LPDVSLPDPPLSDDTVVLRAFMPADVPAIIEACQDPEIPRWTLVPAPYTQDSARVWLDRVADGYRSGIRITLAIVGAVDRALLGAAGLEKIDWDVRAADVGYWLAAPARGRGHATRAVQLLAGWAFGPLGLERLELRANPHNHASLAVAARAGFERVAAPTVRRPECDHLADDFFARLRD